VRKRLRFLLLIVQIILLSRIAITWLQKISDSWENGTWWVLFMFFYLFISEYIPFALIVVGILLKIGVIGKANRRDSEAGREPTLLNYSETSELDESRYFSLPPRQPAQTIKLDIDDPLLPGFGKSQSNPGNAQPRGTLVPSTKLANLQCGNAEVKLLKKKKMEKTPKN